MKKRKTIGLLVHEIDGNFESMYWRSIKNAASKYDCNLIVLEGRELESENIIKKQHNIVYNLANETILDGIIASTGTMIESSGPDELLKHLRHFKNIPMVSIGQAVKGMSSLLVDNRQSMRNVVEHLVKDHRYRRISFIKGKVKNDEANERFEAYLEVLNENNIEVDESLIYCGEFRSDNTYRIMKEQIKTNINFDAMLCANDEMAIGILKAAKELNLNIPGDFAICGFDNTVNSCIVSPTLTTVRQPFEEIADCAFDILLKKIDNQETDDLKSFSGTLVKRESCGCQFDKNTLSSLSDANFRTIRGYKIHENIQTYYMDELFNQITGALVEFSIRSCFIVKYSEGTVYSDYSLVLPEKSKLVYAYFNKQRVEFDNQNSVFDTKEILPRDFFPTDRRFTYLVNPLFFKNEHFGFVVFEVVNDDVVYYELLRGQISNTLKNAILVAERKKMEENLSQRERLASLGHLIGGISHNLNTPIMSISGICLGLEDLIKELRDSIGDPSVTPKDHEDIAKDMSDWLEKLNYHTSYISNTITGVRRQAIQFSTNSNNKFSLEELLGGINLLIKSNLKVRCSSINLNVDVDPNTCLNGEMTNLVQVLYNIIINAYDAYEGLEENMRIIDINIVQDRNNILFAIKDFGTGIPDNIKSKLFKQMVTTRGKNGTGLSLLLSYSTILGKFSGKIWFETALKQGSTFFISIPIKQK
jgi:DNA-binding LacI/PurR family transcriptional regulator/signal transduction histidine kinase